MIANDPKRCRHQCPGGNQCACDAGVKHTLHICDNRRCPCHDQARYELYPTGAERYEAQDKSPRIPVQESQTA